MLRRVGEAGLVGWRGELAEELARWGGRHGLSEQALRRILGAYLFLSRTRRMIQMLGRLARG
jgi:hypothetical protein